MLLVAGFSELAGAVFDRLERLPSLPNLRGQLVLACLDLMPEGAAPMGHRAAPPEEILYLPNAPPRPTTIPGPDAEIDCGIGFERARDDAYWSVLALCTRLGMISGRGFPAHRLRH